MSIYSDIWQLVHAKAVRIGMRNIPLLVISIIALFTRGLAIAKSINDMQYLLQGHTQNIVFKLNSSTKIPKLHFRENGIVIFSESFSGKLKY